MANYDLQSRYLELILGFIGLTDVKRVFVEPTLSGGPDGAEKAAAAAVARAEKIAKKF